MTTGPTDPPQDQPPQDQDTPPVDQPPKDEPPKDESLEDKGFPSGTRVEEMTAQQQTAYWRDKSQKHEKEWKAWSRAAGDLTPDQVREAMAEREKMRQERLSEQEKAVEEARTKARADTIGEYGPRLARTAFELALGDMPDDERDAIIGDLNLAKFVDEDGAVDTAKVKATVARIAPTDTGTGGQREDYGGGRRQTTKTSGIDAGRDLFERERDRHVPAADTSS